MLAKAAIDQVPVEIVGLGFFTSHKHPEFIQENEKTGEMVLFPPRISCRIQSEPVDDAISVATLLTEYTKSGEVQMTTFVQSLVAIIVREIQKGQEIEVPGIGVFKNIITHQTEFQRLSFVPDEQLKELVNAPFNCFEPVVIAEGHAEAVVVTEQVNVPDKELVAEEFETELVVSPEHKAVVDEVVVANTETAVEEVLENTTEGTSLVIEEVAESIETFSECIEEKSIEKIEDASKKTIEETPVAVRPVAKDDSSTNKLLYTALVLILCACGFIVWLIFGNNSGGDSDNTIDAIVVTENNIEHKEVEDSNTEEDVVIDSVAESPVFDDKNTADISSLIPVEKEKSKPVVEDLPNPVVAERLKPETEEMPESVAEEQPKPVVKESEKPREFHRMIGADGNPVMVTLQPGERLTLVALQNFGDKAFWPYVFDANADKLKAPNLVQAGMKLYLPDPAYYHIDANDQESLRKAKNRGAQLMK